MTTAAWFIWAAAAIAMRYLAHAPHAVPKSGVAIAALCLVGLAALEAFIWGTGLLGLPLPVNLVFAGVPVVPMTLYYLYCRSEARQNRRHDGQRV